MSEAKDEHSNKVHAMLVMADSCRVAAEEGIADYLQGRVRVGGHPAGVSSKTEMAVNKVLQASAQAETKVGPIRSSAGIELMRKAQTAGDVGPQLMLGSEKREKAAKLELVDIRMISLRKCRVWGLLVAIRCGVAVPHKFELGISGKGIIEEGSKAQVGIGAKIGNCDGYRRGGHGEGPLRPLTSKPAHLPLCIPP